MTETIQLTAKGKRLLQDKEAFIKELGDGLNELFKEGALERGISAFFKWVEWYYHRHLESEVLCDIYTNDDEEFSKIDEDLRKLIIEMATKFKELIKTNEKNQIALEEGTNKIYYDRETKEISVENK